MKNDNEDPRGSTKPGDETPEEALQALLYHFHSLEKPTGMSDTSFKKISLMKTWDSKDITLKTMDFIIKTMKSSLKMFW